MKNDKLFILLVGCTPPGRNTEQHDVFFTIATSLEETIPALKQFWPEGVDGMHLDGWREIKNVDGFNIEIVPREKTLSAEQSPSLFFINLGGYKESEFEEFHYKIIVVANNISEAIKKSKETAFYKHTGYKGAESHVDDKYGVDADDVHLIEDILPADVRDKFRIQITKSEDIEADEINLGYFQLSKLEKLVS